MIFDIFLANSLKNTPLAMCKLTKNLEAFAKLRSQTSRRSSLAEILTFSVSLSDSLTLTVSVSLSQSPGHCLSQDRKLHYNLGLTLGTRLTGRMDATGGLRSVRRFRTEAH